MSHRFKHFNEYCSHSKKIQRLIVLFVDLPPDEDGGKRYKTSVYDCDTKRCKHRLASTCVLFREVTR